MTIDTRAIRKLAETEARIWNDAFGDSEWRGPGGDLYSDALSPSVILALLDKADRCDAMEKAAADARKCGLEDDDDKPQSPWQAGFRRALDHVNERTAEILANQRNGEGEK